MRIALIIFITLLAGSCTKENSNQFYPYTHAEINDTNWHSVVPNSAKVRQLDSIFAIHPVADSVDAVNGGTIHIGDSIRISFPPAFAAGSGGATISGKVKVEITPLNSKGDMVRMDKPTMSYDRLLVTGGSMHIRVTANGLPLQLAQGKTINVKYITKMSNTTPSSVMKVFYGKEDAYPVTAVQPFTWIPSPDSSINWVNSIQDSATGLRGYNFLSNRFGWVNCDYFSDTTQPRTKAIVTLPPNFTNANTNVYAVFKSPDIVAQLNSDAVTKKFFINNIYTGKVVVFITMSFIDGKLYLGAKELTVVNNMNVSIIPEQKTKQQIDFFLESL